MYGIACAVLCSSMGQCGSTTWGTWFWWFGTMRQPDAGILQEEASKAGKRKREDHGFDEDDSDFEDLKGYSGGEGGGPAGGRRVLWEGCAQHALHASLLYPFLGHLLQGSPAQARRAKTWFAGFHTQV